jgi:hypothetical protein
MTVVKESATNQDFLGTVGRELDFTFSLTGATLTDPSITLFTSGTGATPYTGIVPTCVMVGNDIVVEFTSAQSTTYGLTNPGSAVTLTYDAAAYVNGSAERKSLFAGKITFDKQGKGNGFTSTTVPATVTVGATVLVGTITVGAPTRLEREFYPAAKTSTAINAAVALAAAAGGGVVCLSGDDYDVTGLITLDTVSLRGTGMFNTTLVRNPSYTAGSYAASMIKVTGSNVAIEDLCLESDGVIIGAAVLFDADTTVQANLAVRRCRFTNQKNYCIRFSSPVDGCEVVDNTLDDGEGGVSFQCPASPVSKNIKLSGNTLRDMSAGLQIYSPDDAAMRYYDVEVNDNTLYAYRVTTVIPIELSGVQRCKVTGNSIGTGATRGVSTRDCIDLVMSGNTTDGQSVYAFEVGNGSNVTVIGNTGKNCGTFLQVTNGPLDGLTIIGNTIEGTPWVSTQTNAYMINTSAEATSRLLIANNTFKNCPYMTGMIRIGGTTITTDAIVEGNEIYCSDANHPVHQISVNNSVRALVRHNLIVISRDLVSGDGLNTVIAAAATAVNPEITDNTIVFTGVTSAAANVTGVGLRNTGAGVAPGHVYARNNIVGAPIGIYSVGTSTDMQIYDNKTRTCTAADTIPATVGVRRDRLETEGVAAPSSGTWKVGDRCWNLAPSAAGVPGWVCTTAGTPGTWKAMAAVAA